LLLVPPRAANDTDRPDPGSGTEKSPDRRDVEVRPDPEGPSERSTLAGGREASDARMQPGAPAGEPTPWIRMHSPGHGDDTQQLDVPASHTTTDAGADRSGGRFGGCIG